MSDLLFLSLLMGVMLLVLIFYKLAKIEDDLKSIDYVIDRLYGLVDYRTRTRDDVSPLSYSASYSPSPEIPEEEDTSRG